MSSHQGRGETLWGVRPNGTILQASPKKKRRTGPPVLLETMEAW